MAPTGVEARTSPRVDVRLSAEVKLAGKTLTATTRNLSVGGVCIEADIAVPDGSELDVGLFLVLEDIEDASAAPVVMRGRVQWSAPGEGTQPATYGIRFESVSAPQMAALTGFLKLVGST
jgi:hypothetical protein